MSEKPDDVQKRIEKMRANTEAKKLRTAARPLNRPRIKVKKARHTENPEGGPAPAPNS